MLNIFKSQNRKHREEIDRQIKETLKPWDKFKEAKSQQGKECAHCHGIFINNDWDGSKEVDNVGKKEFYCQAHAPKWDKARSYFSYSQHKYVTEYYIVGTRREIEVNEQGGIIDTDILARIDGAAYRAFTHERDLQKNEVKKNKKTNTKKI